MSAVKRIRTGLLGLAAAGSLALFSHGGCGSFEVFVSDGLGFGGAFDTGFEEVIVVEDDFGCPCDDGFFFDWWF